MVLRNFQVNDLRILAWLIEFSPLGNTKSAQKWQFLEWFSIFRILSCSYMVIYVNFCVLKTFAVILRHLQKISTKKKILRKFHCIYSGLDLDCQVFSTRQHKKCRMSNRILGHFLGTFVFYRPLLLFCVIFNKISTKKKILHKFHCIYSGLDLDCQVFSTRQHKKCQMSNRI